MKPLISCDPGYSGAICWKDADGDVQCENMPPTYTDIADFLRGLKLHLGDCSCVMEKTGTHFAGNNASASVKFSRHCGNLESSLYVLGIPTKQVAPSVWQKKLGSLSKDKKVRKNEIKQQMAALYPHIRVTLKNADALAILTVEGEQ